MSYISFDFYVLVLVSLIVYYLATILIKRKALCRRIQSSVLLIASLLFYHCVSDDRGLLLFGLTIILTYGFGRGMTAIRRRKMRNGIARTFLLLAVVVSTMPLFVVKTASFALYSDHVVLLNLIVPIGLSFYTLQIISYLSDCFTGKVIAEQNIADYALYIAFFPQIIQGPIPRYGDLSAELKQCHFFNFREITRGIQLILWGLFLKMMIADKVAGPVNLIFDHYEQYYGFYIPIAGILYSVQLYADFYSCVTICQGVAKLFGIQLKDNFQRPYMATSIKEFWRRWHISLSTWFRDYIYIPLGGSRKGTLRTYLNLMIVFLVSGFWHGNGINFLAWGLLHGIYQIAGKLTDPLRESIYGKLGMKSGSLAYNAVKRLGNFFWVTFAWFFFRARTLTDAIHMLGNTFKDFNPWVMFGSGRFSFGLDVHDWFVLICAMGVLIAVSACQERRIVIRDWFGSQHTLVRLSVYILVICALWIFGAYGYGFNAADFIYGGF